MKERQTYYLFGLSFLPVTKLTIMFILAFLIFANTTLGFATWEANEPAFQDTIEIGEGTEMVVVSVTENPTEEQRLVPLNAFLGPNDIDHYIYQFNLYVNKAAKVQVSVENAQLNHKEVFTLFDALVYSNHTPLDEASSQLIIDIPNDAHYDEMIDDVYLIEVFVKAFFHPPLDEITYLNVRRQTLSFDVVFRTVEKE